MSSSIPAFNNVPARPAAPQAPAASAALRAVAAPPAEPAPAATPVKEASPPPDPRERASRVAAELARIAPPTSSLRFRVDPDSNEVVVSVVDAKTGDVLRQIPSDEALAIARSLAETGSGIVSDRA
jgi:flagellar protein FlaG